MKNLSIVIIGIVLLFQVSCSFNEERTKEDNKAVASLPNSLDGIYVGAEEMCYIDSLGKKDCYKDPSRPEWKWYHLGHLKIKEDSVFLDQFPISIYLEDTLHSVSDGAAFFYSGKNNKEGEKVIVNLDQLFCFYCAIPFKLKSDGTREFIKVKKQFNGKITNRGLLLDGILYKRISHKDPLLSENPNRYID